MSLSKFAIVAYFRRTWINRFTPEVWNEYEIINIIVTRTNNPLERSNREIYAAFATPHPNMATFITATKALSSRYVATLDPVETIGLPVAVDPSRISDDDSNSDEDGDNERVDSDSDNKRDDSDTSLSSESGNEDNDEEMEGTLKVAR